MKRFTSMRPTILALLLFISPISLLAGSGNSGMAFLKLGISARGVAMGDAMSASVNGAASTFYNPAGLRNPGSPESSAQILVMHKEWIQSTQSHFLAGSFMVGTSDAFGISINATTISDIEIRSRPGTPEGTFTSLYFAAGFSYAHSFSENVSLGGTAKFLFEKIFIDDASGFAFDIGGQYKTGIEHLVLGMTLSNIGSVNALQTESTVLPTALRLGPAYSFDIKEISSFVTLASDGIYIFPDKETRAAFGGELIYKEVFALRGGYQVGAGGRGISVGTGFRQGIISLDYGFAPLSMDLGNSHIISLVINL